MQTTARCHSSCHANCCAFSTTDLPQRGQHVTFPATTLLKREEVETGKTTRSSVITAIHHSGGKKHLMFKDAPFDLLYGFRGQEYNVDLLSAYEMLLWWSMERITVPTTVKGKPVRSAWTEEGRIYKQQCAENKVQPQYRPGTHYKAIAGAYALFSNRNNNAHLPTHIHSLLRPFATQFAAPPFLDAFCCRNN